MRVNTKKSKVKYLNYLTGIVTRYEKEHETCPHLRMAVIIDHKTADKITCNGEKMVDVIHLFSLFIEKIGAGCGSCKPFPALFRTVCFPTAPFFASYITRAHAPKHRF